MFRQIGVILCTAVIASGILVFSIFRTASVKYSFSTISTPILASEDTQVKYELPYPGGILPDSSFWFLKMARDKLWLFVTTNPGKKADLLLLFADKRLAASKILFEKGKPAIAFSTLTKAEKYLEEAARQEEINRGEGINTSVFLTNVATSSIIHRKVIEEILKIAPDDARPKIIEMEKYSEKIYEKSVETLTSLGIEAPKSPFNGN